MNNKFLSDVSEIGKRVFFFTLLLTLFSCTSVEKYNQKLQQPIPSEKLIKDVDYVQHKLEKLHPSLYKYISKETLNQKFDSLKKTINKPMTSKEFYFAFSPVIAAIRQGHMVLGSPSKRISKKEQKRLAKSGTGPLSQFDFEWIDSKLYVIKNKSSQKAIANGAEVLSINRITPQEIYDKYRKTYSSDGFNTTYLPKGFSKKFSIYLTNEIGINDSLSYVFKQNDSVKNIVIHRLKPEKKEKLKSDVTTHPKEKEVVLTKKEKRIYGYDKSNKTFSKNLSFASADSTVAVLKIRDFSKGSFHKAYDAIFKKLKQKEASTLVIDLRNNPGGKVADVVELYSYLTDKNFVMLQNAEVTSKTSLWKLGIFNQVPVITYPFVVVLYPFYMGFTTIKTKKQDDGTYTYSLVGSRNKNCNPNHFNGKIYVIINGGSFSASCLLASTLKANKEVTFVGEETGGGFNSTVAGLLPILKLHNSELLLRIGLMDIKTTSQTEVFGRGIFPDAEVVPTVQDRVQNIDPEMTWILQDIKSKAN